jgi:ActR/RegA family two-component response regulator
MSNNLLLVTADASFAKALHLGLERAGHRLHPAKTRGEAVVRADEHNCALAFLDIALGERAIHETGTALRALKPTIKLVLFCDEDTPPALDSLRPWALLRKPYYLPDVLTMINEKSTPISSPCSKSPRANERPRPALVAGCDQSRATPHAPHA